MGKLRIQALGTSFTIQSEEDEEYLNKLFGYYKKITDEVSQISSIKTPLQIAILSGMMICDELYKEKQNKVALENGAAASDSDNQADFFDAEEIEQRTLDMISKIDQVL
ncbi:MAG: cell division protein ZapA [Treponema sp.]|nr:cell division protein ZapA [Treponema sp.]